MLTTPSKDTVEFLKNNRDESPTKLALQAKRYPNVDMAWVVQQVQGRQKAKEKLPQWYRNESILYPPSLSMEQCSSEATARYKSELVSGTNLFDLTGGMGVDIAYMSRSFSTSTYIERSEQLALTALHNFSLLELPIDVLIGDGTTLLSSLNHADCIYLDPARRNNAKQKTMLLVDCEPNIVDLKELLVRKANCVLVKLSPLFDITELLRFFPEAYQIHVVAADNECKELLLLLDKRQNQPTQIVAVNLLKNGGKQHFCFEYQAERKLAFPLTDTPLAYLYEPNAAIQKSGGLKSYALELGAKMLHPNSKLYTSQNRIPDFQGRSFAIESIFGFSKQELNEHLSDTEQANITVRNFPLSVDELRKKLKLKDGGNDYLFATTLASEKKVLIRCRKDS